MKPRSLAFPRRFLVWAVLLALAVLACLSLAVTTRRNTSGTVRELADVELTTTAVRTRQFNTDLDDLHDALLKMGVASAGDSRVIIQLHRQRLNEWLSNRLTAARSEREREILLQMTEEMRSYSAKLDALPARPGGLGAPLDLNTIVMFNDYANRLRSMAREFAAVRENDLQYLLQTSLGSVLWMRDLVFACVGLLLAAIGALVVLLYRDVVRPLHGQLVESEALLMKSEKLAALGTLAAGVAHEIRNPLTAIKARLYTLRRTLTAEDSNEDVKAITSEVDRLERIVRDVLEYARPSKPALGSLELSAWLREFQAFIKEELSARSIEFSTDIAATAVVRADPNQLQQIMLNLVRNAQEALGGRHGRIVLALRRERAQLRGRDSDVAVLTVADDGPGIPAEVQARLFDPFFTTKAAGTGLGLSIVARLVENQGGEIGFQTGPRMGTRFAVRLPIGEEGRQAVQA
ncbi:MAG: ATP-binding protein [Opitutaceae bacterium]|jgi:signal transduction histidine kinase